MKTNLLIIGGGPAAITASKVIKTINPNFDITILRPEEKSLIYCAIPYVIEGLIEEEKIYKKDEIVTGIGVNLIKEKARSVDLKLKQVITDQNKIITYDKLLITTGAIPKVPNIIGIDSKNIYSIKTAENMRTVKEKIKDNAKIAVVVGVGAIGVEQALAYKNLGLEVHLIDVQDRPLCNMLDSNYGNVVLDELNKLGIICHFSTKPTEFIKNKNGFAIGIKMISLVNNEEKNINLSENDFIISSVGFGADIELFKNTGLDISKHGIVVDQYMNTNVKDVYAAGDCCQFYSGINNQIILGKLATNAVPMGRVAAMNIMGLKYEYKGFYNGAVTVIGELRVGGTGFTEDTAKEKGYRVAVVEDEATSRFPIMPGAKKIRVKLIYEKDNLKIIGGQVVGYEAVAERIDLITMAIQQKMDLKELSMLSYAAQPWQTFYPAKNPITEAAFKEYLKFASL